MSNFFNNPHLWVDVCFVLFFLIFGKIIFTKGKEFLDDKITSISSIFKDLNERLTNIHELFLNKKDNFKNLRENIEKDFENQKNMEQAKGELYIENLDVKYKNKQKSLEEHVKISKDSYITKLNKEIVEDNYVVVKATIKNSISEKIQDDLIDKSIEKFDLFFKKK